MDKDSIKSLRRRIKDLRSQLALAEGEVVRLRVENSEMRDSFAEFVRAFTSKLEGVTDSAFKKKLTRALTSARQASAQCANCLNCQKTIAEDELYGHTIECFKYSD